MTVTASTAKAELHLHAGGSYPIEYLLKNASQEDAEALKKFQNRISQGVDYNEAFGIFGIISRIINSNEKVEEGTYELCMQQKKDGVTRLELRSGLKSLNENGEESYLQSFLNGIKRADMCATVVLSVRRDSTVEYVQKTCDLALEYRQRGVVGIDISGDSTIGDISPLLETLKKARDAGLFITAHIGESTKEKDQMQILQQLKPHRVGHGARLVPEAIDWIRANIIPVEVCPTSARLCGMHEKDEVHPWVLEHKKTGHPIIICTDDPTVFGTTLTKEYCALEPVLGSDVLIALAQASHTYAFGVDE